jgi:hypothetical protein
MCTFQAIHLHISRIRNILNSICQQNAINKSLAGLNSKHFLFYALVSLDLFAAASEQFWCINNAAAPDCLPGPDLLSARQKQK